LDRNGFKISESEFEQNESIFVESISIDFRLLGDLM